MGELVPRDNASIARWQIDAAERSQSGLEPAHPAEVSLPWGALRGAFITLLSAATTRNEELEREVARLRRTLTATLAELERFRCTGVDHPRASTYAPNEMPDLEPLRRWYGALDAPWLQAFFARHPQTVPALVEVHHRLRETFGPGIEVRIEEPDPLTGFDDLAFVRAYKHGLDVEEALRRLDAMLDAWWYDLPNEITVPLNIAMGWG